MISCLLGIRGISFHATDKEAMEDHTANTVYQSGSQQPQGTSGLTNSNTTETYEQSNSFFSGPGDWHHIAFLNMTNSSQQYP